MIKRFFKFLFKLALWFIVASVVLVLVYKWVPVYYTPLMAIRSIEASEPYKTSHQWVSIDHISKDLQLAVICAEDQNFVKHNGFDLKAIEKAYEQNKKGKRVRGASTISQQTAKNVFLWPSRNWFRKGLETYFTFLIELVWSKERILEVYLNSIEMGVGVYGAEAASKHWFHKSANKLTRSEAASLAIILPNPRQYKANGSTNYIVKRRQWVMQQMRYFGTFNFQELK